MAVLSQATLDAIGAAVAAAFAAQASAPVATPVAEASQHFKARDLACTAAKPCSKTFRTAKGVAWHVANVEHAPKAK